jgi:Inner membrane component of T3SS, cytoplasmic domain/Family of unknown function (DUF6519)
MASDRARVSYDPKREWRGVIAQQGRVSVEADWNEAATISEERDRHATLDVVGRVGTPDDGYTVTPAAAEGEQAESTPGHFTIGKGTLYLGGERLHLDEQVHYRTQPDWLDHSTDPLWDPPAVRDRKGRRHELVYLLASEQEVSAVEDPALADVALGGPDTTQRRRIIQRFARHPSESGTCDGSRSALERSLADHGLQLDPASMTAESTGKLQVSFPNSPTAARVGRPAPGGGYLGAENQMIRVMVVGDKEGELTIVWGLDDASFLYRVYSATPAAKAEGTEAEGTTLTLASAPVDSYHYPEKGQAVELLRDAVKLTENDYIASPHGFVSTLTRAYDPTSKQLLISGKPPGDYLATGKTPQLYLRVWQATARARAGKPILLGDTGVAVTLTTSGRFHVGDFWRFALRPIQPAIVYPERYLAEPQPPDGPRIWACPLAVLTWDDEEHLRASSCIPQFSGLAEMAGRKAGCCTVDVRPEDVDDGAALQALLDGYAHQGPVTICLEPGTYTLRAPLVLGPEHDGLTLQACREHVVLQAPRRPGEEFVFGLVAIRDAASVTIRGIELALPHVRFSPNERSFSGLRRPNHELLTRFCRGLHVAIGISVHDSVDLAVKDCTFLHPDPGGANSFCAGIFATGAMEGVEITGCAFQPVSPSTTDRRRRRDRWSADRARPPLFYELATGGKVDSAHQLSFGVLQVPRFGSGHGIGLHRLDEVTVEKCLFQGMTVPALVMAHIGAVHVNQNTVRSSYGGFWFVSLADPELCVMFGQIAVGDADAYQETSASRGGAALLDRILVMATAIGQVLPWPHRAGGRPAAGRAFTPDAALLALARQKFSDFYTQAAESAELPRAIDALLRNLDVGVPESAHPAAEEGQGRYRGSQRDHGRPLSLRLDLGDCQIDDIITDARCGAGLLVADFTAEAGSVLLHDNRIRSRFPGGETVFVGGIGEACVTGNVIANEVEHDKDEQKSHSLGLNHVTQAVAITGNVFIDPPRLPERHSTGPHDTPLEPWRQLNTVIDYVRPTGPQERTGRAGSELEREVLEETGTETQRIGSLPRSSALQIRVLDGVDAGRTFDLAQGDHTIGRALRSQIQLEDPVVSLRHALLSVSDENVTIEDLNSTNGTKVNDVAVENETPVAPGDQINVGGVTLMVEQHQATSPDDS